MHFAIGWSHDYTQYPMFHAVDIVGILHIYLRNQGGNYSKPLKHNPYFLAYFAYVLCYVEYIATGG